MAKALPGSTYTVERGDTLSSIALEAYGDANEWLKIYDANAQTIGDDPNSISVGEVLYIPGAMPRTCEVISASGLNIRAAATSNSALIVSYPQGTILNFVEVVDGEDVNGNPHWGRSEQGHYFWLGGTDHPNG